MKAEHLSAQLNIDLQDLTEALDEAVSRGLLLQETHYDTEVAGSANKERTQQTTLNRHDQPR